MEREKNTLKIAQGNNRNIFGSFRDPNGFVFLKDDQIYRQISLTYKEDYDYLISSGLYKKLVDSDLLIAHTETQACAENSDSAYKIIKPEIIPFISYPYEWCFSQLKEAALATLEIQKTALDFGMILKDATAYNIQFKNGKPLFMDTLSFQRYREGQPWDAYRQFCQHFIAPLALMSSLDVRLNQLSRNFIDGLPLDLASSLLPLKTRFKTSLLTHIHFHSLAQRFYTNRPLKSNRNKLSRFGLYALIDNLKTAIESLKWKPAGFGWPGYYKETNYSPEAMQHKEKVIVDFLFRIKPTLVFDVAANTGFFSRIASRDNIQIVSFDSDYSVVEQNYLECKKNNEKNILPLVIDITNPSPGVGWANKERMAFFGRSRVDVIMVLAFVHHLVIEYNIPFKEIASFFQKNCKFLIIEFVPKNDSKAKLLLANREGAFDDYNRQSFEHIFRQYFEIESFVEVRGSERALYLLKSKETTHG